jgi:signal peptide peptidase SppA
MLPHLATRLFGVPLLIHRPKLELILGVLGDRLGVSATSIAPIAAIDPRFPTDRLSAVADRGIAVIPVYGSLVKRALAVEAASGLTAYGQIALELQRALDDPSVRGVLLDIDSPGGEAAGSFELARRVREACAIKPVWAIANDSAFSAAYAIACGADQIFMTETAGVGSIGVIAMHLDQSVRDAQQGYRYTAITAGSHKDDFSPHAPLSDPARGALQSEVDRLYEMFVSHVARMRGLERDRVRDTEAALFFGEQALAACLADGVGTFEEVHAQFVTHLSRLRRLSSPAQLVIASGTTTSVKEIEMSETQPDHLAADPVSATNARGVQATAVVEPAFEAAAAPHTPVDIAPLIAQARADAARSAQAIAEMCLIAGCPERAAEFIAAGAPEGAVRKALIDARAQKSAEQVIRSSIEPAAGTQTQPSRPEDSPVVAAVKKLVHKE